jgi:hypothetical protein
MQENIFSLKQICVIIHNVHIGAMTNAKNETTNKKPVASSLNDDHHQDEHTEKITRTKTARSNQRRASLRDIHTSVRKQSFLSLPLDGASFVYTRRK